MPSPRKFSLIVRAALLGSLIGLIYLDIRPPFFELEDCDESEEIPEENELSQKTFQNALLDAVEALEYMYSSQTGKAKVNALFEPTTKLEEIRKCFGIVGPNKILGSNRQWIQNGKFLIYSAHLDGRKNSMFPPNIQSVQILASHFGVVPLSREYYCHFRHYRHYQRASERWEGTVTKAQIRWIWQRAWDPRNQFYNSFLISCPATGQHWDLKFDSLVMISRNQFCVFDEEIMNFTTISKPSQSKMIIKQTVFGLRPEQIKIAVCVKGMSFLDESELTARKVVEWTLLQRALGAGEITLYIYWIPDAVRRVLQRMAQRDYLELVELDLPGNSPNQPFTRHQFIMRNRQQKRRHELIAYNDCFYSYSSTNHFVLIVDIDEVIFSLRHQNWQGLLHKVLGKGKWRAEPSSISIRNVYKIVGQNEQSLFTNPWRSSEVQERNQYGKSFVSTRSVASVFNHFSLHRLHSNVSGTMHVNPKDAIKLHWKSECPEAELGTEKCAKLAKNLVEENLLKRFREELEGKVEEILNGI